MSTVTSTADLLLAAAIKDRDPDTFRALADVCEENGDERMATGWRDVAKWIETPFENDMDPSCDLPHRWPRGSDERQDVWFWAPYAKGSEAGNSTPFQQYKKFTTTKQAMTWLAECFGDS